MAVRLARSDPGVVYTPRDVCEPMVRLALAPLLAAGRDPATIRVCDPAIGEGAFLVEIVRVLAEALGDGVAARAHIANACLHGIDIDATAVDRAREAVERFVGAPCPALRQHLRVGDALATAWSQRFDVVVGNPPYVRQELLANKPALRRFASYDGVADLYVYFIELAQQIGDRFCLVVPNKWMTASYGRKLRETLARAGRVEGIVDFAGGLPLFRDADAFPCILWGGTQAATHDAIRATRITAKVSVARALADPGAPHARSGWTVEPWHIDAHQDAALLERLRTHGRPLGDIIGSRWSRGVVTGCNAAFVIDRDTRARLIAEEPAAESLIRPFVKGRDLRRWTTPTPDRFVLLVDRGTSLDGLPRVRAHLARFRTQLEPRPREHTAPWPGRKPGPYRWYELQDPVVPLAVARPPRLLYQDIQTAPVCSLDRQGLVPDTTVWILPTGDLFLLALLSSPLYFWYARRRFPPALNGAVRPKLEYMRALPVAEPRAAVRRRIETLVELQLQIPDAERDREIASLVADAYALSPAERALIGS